MSDTDTIAAIATPPGRGGIAITRVSGSLALQVAQQICRLTPEPQHAYLRKFRDGEEVVDEGVVLFYKAPHSYTGEDVLELQGHGGSAAPHRVLGAVLKIAGTRQARAGEFTQRAFLNGKLDLTQAEAVEDLISSGTNSAAKAAMASLEGAFAAAVNVLNDRLTEFRVKLEACLDFPEEHEDFFDSGVAQDELENIRQTCSDTLAKAGQGVKLQEGARIVLVGEPNVGKSSLMNALAQKDHAIVTDIPGTTRDTLSADIEIGGVRITLTDTAGIRDDPGDEIEAMGIDRAIGQIRQADLILMLVDGSAKNPGCTVTLEKILEITGGNPNLVVVRTKQDLNPQHELDGVLAGEPFNRFGQAGCTVRQEGGLDELTERIKEALDILETEGVFSARQRHCSALKATMEALLRAEDTLEIGDLVLCAREISIAQNNLGEITGKVTSDDILGRIFATFCIGK